MKTINESYSLKQRKEIAESLRGIPKTESANWQILLPPKASDYVKRVLGVLSFSLYLSRRNFSIGTYPLGGRYGYIHDALNRLADELDPPKEQSK